MDLLAIEPYKVSTNLKSYTYLIYGVPKIGKTTLAMELYKAKDGEKQAILAATEKGYKRAQGALIQDIGTWRDWQMFIKQLQLPAVQEKFGTVIVDTVDILWGLAEKYILSMNNVKKLKDVAFGALYKDLDKLFFESIQQIERLGYTLVFISHAKVLSAERPDVDEQGNVQYDSEGKPKVIQFSKYIPSMEKRGLPFVTGMVDNILFCNTIRGKDGLDHRAIFTRETEQWQAGTRFDSIPSILPLKAESLMEAIKKDNEQFGHDETTEEVVENFIPEEVLDFGVLMATANELCQKIVDMAKKVDGADSTDEQVKARDLFGELGATHFAGNKISQAKPTQVEQLDLVNIELSEHLAKLEAKVK